MRYVTTFIMLVSVIGCAGPAMVTEREYHEDGTVTETEMSEAAHIEGKRLELGAEIVKLQTEAVKPADTNMSSQGEVAHSFQVIGALDKTDKMLGSLGSGYFDAEIANTHEWHQTGRAALYVLAPDLLRYALHGGDSVIGQGGTYIKQNNTVTDSDLSNSGDLIGGPGAPGGVGGEAPGAPGGTGAPATGGSRNISVGGIGNMSNSQDAYNGFQSRFDQILHGQGAIGKQPCIGGPCTTDDADEGSLSLF